MQVRKPQKNVPLKIRVGIIQDVPVFGNEIVSVPEISIQNPDFLINNLVLAAPFIVLQQDDLGDKCPIRVSLWTQEQTENRLLFIALINKDEFRLFQEARNKNEVFALSIPLHDGSRNAYFILNCGRVIRRIFSPMQ